MKRMIVLLVCLTALIFSACSREEVVSFNELKEMLSLSGVKLDTENLISLKTEKKRYTNTTEEIFVEYTNLSNEPLITGHWSEVEILIDGEWYTIPLKPNVGGTNDVAFVILPDGSLSMRTNLMSYDFSWPSGTYRVLRMVQKEHSTFQRIYAAEFTIK